MTNRLLAALLLASGLLALVHTGAEARIMCDGNFQNVNGWPVSTLYCREATLARVARGFGFRVSEQAIRYNESTKAGVCRAIGFDNRVQEVCAPYRSDGGSAGRNSF